MSGFGAGLGAVIGSSLGANDLSNAQGAINANTGNLEARNDPFESFGAGMIGEAGSNIQKIEGQAGNVQGYDQFMQNYQTTPAAQYQMQQADAVQNSSAAAQGSLLSGANERALSTVNQGVASQNANTAYTQYLAGNNQQFGQLEQSLGNMFQAIGVGQTATGQDAGVVNTQNAATANIAGNQAKNDQAKGSGIGSMLGGLMPSAKF